ncbi:MAG: efflux RND transporter permease subunit [Acetobacteraceae bacterium]
MISAFFINRPVLANVLAIVMVLLGAVSVFQLPVAQYPNIVPPTVQVTTTYPGASATDVMNTVALPIEQQVNGVDGMIYMQSTSASDGTYSLIVTFAIGTDLDFAQVLVQNKVSAALSSLPTAVQAQGVVVQKKSTAILQIVALTGDKDQYDSLFLANYGTITLQPELARLKGVGQVNIFGAGQYAMRVWLDPDQLKARGLTTQDVQDALQKQSQQVSAGQVGAPPSPQGVAFQYTLNIFGRLDTAEEFEKIIVKTGQDGTVTRLRDVGRVELGAQTYSQSFTVNGRRAAGLAIYQTPNANALAVAREVSSKMAELSKAFPPGMQYSIPFDTTLFVTASIDEVYRTLIEAGILVLIVILVFLQDWRATLVPATTVPVTIIGAFAAMAALGFTVNLSTLFALVLAIGIVVDDAIVVVEGAAHQIEQGLSPHDAAIKAMDQLFGPIVGITLVLMSVFIPSAFLPGLTGQLYAQFALVISATALLSAINAATLKPTQCALWLRVPVPPEKRNPFFRAFNAAYDPVERGYARLIAAMGRHAGKVAILGLILIGVAFASFARVPTGFLPLEDQGYVMVSVQLPEGASLQRTQRAMDKVTKLAREVPGVDTIVSISGISVIDNSATLANAGVAYVILKDWSVRGKNEDLRSIFFNLTAKLQAVEEATILIIPPPPIQGIGNSGGFTMMVELRDGSADLQKLGDEANAVVQAAGTQSALTRVATSYRAAVPQFRVSVDRTKAETHGVTVGQVFETLSAYMGSTYVGQFNKFSRTFQVYIQADKDYRARLDDILQLPVRTQNNTMVPMGTLVDITPMVGPSLITLYNLYPAATILGSPAPGFSSGEAMDLMEQVSNATLPPGSSFDWSAMSFQEKAVGNQIIFAFGLAILLVYLVLAGQYESWLAPITVVLAVPLSLLGPATVLEMTGLDNNLYVQIGLILLIALSAKNAILIVEVAREERILHGKPILEAAVTAARIRFRPIIMTSFAFILGVLPLVLATGAGASARKSIGVTVFSGMLASTCLAVVFVPSFFVLVQRLEERLMGAPKPTPHAPPAPAE